MADGGYEPIVERMFIRLDLDSFSSIRERKQRRERSASAIAAWGFKIIEPPDRVACGNLSTGTAGVHQRR